MNDKRYSCAHVVPIEQEPRHHLVIENEFVRAFAVEIAPHDRTLCHHHPHDYLLYVAGDAEIISAARDEEPKKLSYRDGECELLEAGMVHVVENVGETHFRNIVIELLPRFEELRRGPNPWRVTPSAAIPPHFDNEKVAIFRDETNAPVLLRGPAVVASTNVFDLAWNKRAEDSTMVDGLLTTISNLKGLAYIPDGGLGILGSHGAELVVFQLGACGEEPSGVRARDVPLKSLRAHAEETG